MRLADVLLPVHTAALSFHLSQRAHGVLHRCHPADRVPIGVYARLVRNQVDAAMTFEIRAPLVRAVAGVLL
jgi:hypothetical protein